MRPTIITAFILAAWASVSVAAPSKSTKPRGVSTVYHRKVPEVPYYTQRPKGLNGIQRKYFFSVEEVTFDYAPLQYDHFNGGPLNETVAAEWCVQTPTRIGSAYIKAVYREYKDGTYKNRITHPDYMGFVGPIIRAEVGDTIQVTLRNMARHNYSLHAHGVFYNAASDGAEYAGAIGGQYVRPNEQYTYVFEVPERSGPGENDPSSIVWAYTSHVSDFDVDSGLVGPIIIYKKGILDSYGVPNVTKINAEFVALLHVADENRSNYFKDNVKYFLGPSANIDYKDPAFVTSNQMHHINGYVYNNLNAIELQQGDTARWYIMTVGGGHDIHTAHWHGATAVERGHRTDVIALHPASFKTIDVYADNPGTWLFHCHVSIHLMAGMVISYTINQAGSEHGGW